MKKTIITVFAFMVIFSFVVSGAMAQTWTWQYAPVTDPSGITELTANPSTNVLYGISGGSVISVTTGTAVTTGDRFTDGTLSNFSDIAVGFQGAVYAITDTAVASCVPPAACSAIARFDQKSRTKSSNSGQTCAIAWSEEGDDKLSMSLSSPC